MNLSRILKTLILLAAGSVVVAAQEDGRSNIEILTDLREDNLSAEQILGIDAPDSVAIFSLDDFAGEDLQRLQDTLQGTEDGFAEVQTAIARNEALEAIVSKKDVAVSDLVAVTRSDTGDLSVYVNLPRR